MSMSSRCAVSEDLARYQSEVDDDAEREALWLETLRPEAIEALSLKRGLTVRDWRGKEQCVASWDDVMDQVEDYEEADPAKVEMLTQQAIERLVDEWREELTDDYIAACKEEAELARAGL